MSYQHQIVEKENLDQQEPSDVVIHVKSFDGNQSYFLMFDEKERVKVLELIRNTLVSCLPENDEIPLNSKQFLKRLCASLFEEGVFYYTGPYKTTKHYMVIDIQDDCMYIHDGDYKRKHMLREVVHRSSLW